MKFLSKKMLVSIIALSVAATSYAAMGFLTGEQINGMNKICCYDVLGSTYTLNVSSVSLCPLTYNF